MGAGIRKAAAVLGLALASLGAVGCSKTRGAASQGTVFLADDGVHGREPWVTDGTAGGTSMLADICPGRCSSAILPLVPFQGAHWFAARVDEDGTPELWKTDGTKAGTIRVPTRDSARPYENLLWLAPGQETLFYLAGAAGRGLGVWKTTGGAEHQVAETGPRDNACGLVAAGKGLTFAKMGVPHARPFRQQLCMVDPGGAGDVTCSELPAGDEAHLETCQLVPFRGVVYYAGWSSLWKAEGTAATLVKALPEDSRVSELVVLTDRLYFAVRGKDEVLWTSDGTTAGTVPIANVASTARSPHDDFLIHPVAHRGVLYFAAFAPESGTTGQLWRSDGTKAGTAPVIDLHPGLANARILELYDGREALFLVAFDGEHGDELWRTDGTATGTVLVKRLWGDGAAATPRK
jgi:ELWxxDGT repeat protein